MCTASWLITEAGYELFFNRDELRSRAAGEPPRARVADGVAFLAPTDGEAGGTWIAASELGLSVALLNARSAREPADAPRSRGLLVLDLVGSRSAREAGERLARRELGVHRGFRLLAMEPGAERPLVWRWDGERLSEEPARLPLASSSLGSELASERRAGVLEELRAGGPADAALLARFHASHRPERGPWSPCVHRADVETLSATRVSVDAARVVVRHAPGPPCVTPYGEPVALERRAPARRTAR